MYFGGDDFVLPFVILKGYQTKGKEKFQEHTL